MLWTDDQQKAITARDGTLLVSAAAGSGKTAVLVERVLQRLSDPAEDCPADALLIVTFTKAATAQMREKIAAALQKRIREDPTNEHLLRQQALLPFAPNFFPLVRSPAFRRTVESADTKLVQGGFEGLISGEEFAALKLMLLWVLPDIWLRGAVKRRHLAIQKALPFVLDLLTLSVEAGMDFISALQRNCRLRRLDPLNEELLRMTKEIQVGRSRREALKDMAKRVGQPDLRSVAHALVQADELGVSIGAMLRIQSDQLRARRFDRAEKLAAEAPVKMLGPLMLCIFPAVFIILLGPVLTQAMKGVF